MKLKEKLALELCQEKEIPFSNMVLYIAGFEKAREMAAKIWQDSSEWTSTSDFSELGEEEVE